MVGAAIMCRVFAPLNVNVSCSSPGRPIRRYSPFIQALRAAAYLTVHLVLAMIIIGSIFLIDHAITGLGDIRLFDAFPLRYAFNAIDLLILIVFGIMGAIEAINVFRDR